jgi:hypothetical protein
MDIRPWDRSRFVSVAHSGYRYNYTYGGAGGRVTLGSDNDPVARTQTMTTVDAHADIEVYTNHYH